MSYIYGRVHKPQLNGIPDISHIQVERAIKANLIAVANFPSEESIGLPSFRFPASRTLDQIVY